MRLTRLREWRRRRGLTQPELGDLSSLHKMTISRLERDKHEALPSTAQVLATALDVEVGDLVAANEGPPAIARVGDPTAAERFSADRAAMFLEIAARVGRLRRQGSRRSEEWLLAEIERRLDEEPEPLEGHALEVMADELEVGDPTVPRGFRSFGWRAVVLQACPALFAGPTGPGDETLDKIDEFLDESKEQLDHMKRLLDDYRRAESKRVRRPGDGTGA